jgi:hypothetical protein
MKVIGVILIVLALAIAIVPLFTDCQSQGRSIALPNGKTVPMKCHWTGRAELLLAGPLAAVGILMIVGRRKETMRALSIVGIVLGIGVILVPVYLIGVCASNEMLCNLIMKPSLILTGALVIVASVVALVMAGREGPDGPVPGEEAGPSQ